MAASVIGAASTGRRGRRRRAVMSEINVTPFVDVMLVLLIVFMVTAPLLTLSIKVDLPDSRGGTTLNSDKAPLIVSLKKGGGTCTSQADLYLGESPAAAGELDAKLKAIKSTNGQSPEIVWVNADRGVCYNEVAKMLGRLHDAGFGTALNIVPEKGE